jgi:hypothetical protein
MVLQAKSNQKGGDSMKRSMFFLSALSLLLLVACSGEDPVAPVSFDKSGGGGLHYERVAPDTESGGGGLHGPPSGGGGLHRPIPPDSGVMPIHEKLN